VIQIRVTCSEPVCDKSVTVAWPEREYSSTLRDVVTLDGQVALPEGWFAKPGSEGGDNMMRCPMHAHQYAHPTKGELWP
jgi:hypothetical protein